ncbi:50S ribosomal protein L3 [Aquicella siphonis]|uniref:Large ribosomal subunit protein uL3 n=1 Tax=Aquicella siphonis TaxID=254247 RepID=A0A5E4PDX2_9COXI|nr:50S ribosomal protein L3 [Aquicella siphonis]VVC75159.1 50S ribosomal protein L3 [Aquicella siphonis]
MTIGLVGKKCGMTRVFTEDGVSIPVTVIEVLPNRITQVKTLDNDGYHAIQVTTGTCKRTSLTKPEAGHFAKAGVEPGCELREFYVEDAKDLDGLTVGSEIKVDRFTVGQYVDVTGISKGKGFAGVIKRHHFNSQDASHGNSLSHRAPGSIGQRQSPGKVFKGKRMAGHMGDVVRTILSQQIVRIDAERNLVLVRGAVPGATNAYVVIRPAVKKSA